MAKTQTTHPRLLLPLHHATRPPVFTFPRAVGFYKTDGGNIMKSDLSEIMAKPTVSQQLPGRRITCKVFTSTLPRQRKSGFTFLGHSKIILNRVYHNICFQVHWVRTSARVSKHTEEELTMEALGRATPAGLLPPPR